MKVYRVTPDIDCNSHYEDNVEDTLEAVKVWLTEGDIGQRVIIEVLEMSEKEFKNLPEYMGP